jgi:hypothetical protein
VEANVHYKLITFEVDKMARNSRQSKILELISKKPVRAYKKKYKDIDNRKPKII